MNNTLLDQLRPIIQPAHEISAWPLATGWWLLMAFFLVMIAALIFLRPMIKSWKQQKQIRIHTQQLLNTLYLDCTRESDVALGLQHYLQTSNDIFKRIIHKHPHLSHFSHLTGNDWTTFIFRLDPEAPFAKFYGDNLYAQRCQDKINLDELHNWACAWAILATKKRAREITL